MEKINKREAKKESCLDEVREEYEGLKKIHNLPEFSELNKLFDIEEINLGTEFFLRKIRRLMSEKIAEYMRFIEVLLNPSNAPMFFFKLLKKLDNNDKEILGKIYEKLGEIEIETMALDLDYSEEKEAEFIKEIHKIFNDEIKDVLLKIIHKLGNGNTERKKENNGSYFG